MMATNYTIMATPFIFTSRMINTFRDLISYHSALFDRAPFVKRQDSYILVVDQKTGAATDYGSCQKILSWYKSHIIV